MQAQNAGPSKTGKTPAPIVTVFGKIIDRDTKLPLEYSTISIHSRKDSTILTGAIADANGQFSLDAHRLDFFVKIEFMAYLTSFLEITGLPESQAKLDLGTIELAPHVIRTTEVEVRAEKSSVMMALDKRVFNVGRDLTSVGGTAEDVLRNVPGVSIDNDGRFNLRGNGNIRLLLNGRISSLVSNENLSGLRQIRASQIERIEVITNPSARYEAEGMAGIVNIVLKTNHLKGMNGSVDGHFGNNNNMGLGSNINYNKGRFNGFLGLGGWYSNRPGTGSFRNRFYNLAHADSTVFSNVNRTHKRASLPGFVKFGTDFNLNPQNVFTTSFSYRRSSGENSSDLLYKDAVGNVDNIYQVTQRLEDEEEHEMNLLYSLIYKRSFSGKGHQLITDIQYEKQSVDKTSMFEEHYFDGANNPLSGIDYLQLSGNEEGKRRLGINLDYILPLKKEGKFEAGWQSSFREIFNNYEVKEIVNNVENPDVNFTNDFLYQETIHSIYVNFGKTINKLSMQTGLRVDELRHLRAVDISDDAVSVRAHGDWRPKDREERTVPVPRAAATLARELVAWRDTARGRRGRPLGLGAHWIADRLASAWTLARLPGDPPGMHDARRTYATELSRTAGVSVRDVQRLLGHADLSTTERYLGRYRSDAARAAVDLGIAAALSGPAASVTPIRRAVR